MWVCRDSNSGWLEFHVEEPKFNEEAARWVGKSGNYINPENVDDCIKPGVKAEMVSCVMQENGRWLLKVKREPTLAEAVVDYMNQTYPSFLKAVDSHGKFGAYIPGVAMELYQALQREKSK